MPRITFIPAGGAAIEVDAFPQMTLMEAALINDIPGIIGMCGGICSCATCHIYVDDNWQANLPAPSQEEDEMVSALTQSRPGSRLGCQVKVTDAMDGLVVHVAPPED